jgi:hypothetical protein
VLNIGELRGIWIYRSFLNNPALVGDFGKLAVWEAELSLEITAEGRVYGFLGERPNITTGGKPYLFVGGQVGFEDPFEIRWRATGKPGSEYDGSIYDYVGFLAPEWQNATSSRPVAETFSSHVNPIFWHLHGWVDDRIEDWFGAQEIVRPGVIKRRKPYSGDWFEVDKKWVLNDEPWEGARSAEGSRPHPRHEGMDHGGLIWDVPTRQKALTISYGPEASAAPLGAAEHARRTGRQGASTFKRIDA